MIRVRGARALCARCMPVCHHCGAEPEADGDHTCPCPHRDEDCRDHPLLLCAYHAIAQVWSEGP